MAQLVPLLVASAFVGEATVAGHDAGLAVHRLSATALAGQGDRCMRTCAHMPDCLGVISRLGHSPSCVQDSSLIKTRCAVQEKIRDNRGVHVHHDAAASSGPVMLLPPVVPTC